MKPKTIYQSLFLTALLIHITGVSIDPFLQFWDECFHALVAKSMLSDPFTPMLHRETALPLEEGWSLTNIWLHKPPFFLWLIALSMKLFGTSVWAVRLPSAILVSLMPPLLYRMGILIHGKRVAWLAGIMTLCSFYLFELPIGYIPTDHNDVAFIVTITASFWAWLEYHKMRSRKFALLTGLFAGFAFLSKWYLGVLVFLPWTLMLAFSFRQQIKRFMQSVGVFTVVVGAWVVPTYIRFPERAMHEWFFKAGHLNAPIDGHRGTNMFHLDVIQDLVPPLQWSIVLGSIIVSCWVVKRREVRLMMLVPTLFVHALFMYAETKMLSYTMILLPIYLLSFALLCVVIFERFLSERWQKRIFIPLLILLGMASMNVNEVRRIHFDEYGYFADWRERNTKFQAWSKILASKVESVEKAAIFNFESPTNIQFMFHHGHEAMFILPTQQDVDRLIANGYSVYVLHDKNEKIELNGVEFVARN